MRKIMFNFFLKHSFLFSPPHHLRADTRSRAISLAFSIIFILAAVAFAISYGINAIKSCQQTIVNVDYFIEDAPCVCAANIGSSPVMARQILLNSSFASQFSLVYGYADYVETTTIDGYKAVIFSPYITYFFQYVFPLIYTQQLNAQNVSQFSLFPGVFDEETAQSLLTSSYACNLLISYNSSYVESIEKITEEDCLQLVRTKINPNYNDVVEIDYQSNPALASFCDLVSCSRKECPSITAFNTALFISSTIGFIFLLMTFLHGTIFHFWVFQEERTAFEMEETAKYNGTASVC
jgi:hypothetical protein